MTALIDMTQTASQPIARTRRSATKGQNLVELVLTLPFVLALLFFTIDLGRVWMVYEGAKMAARDAAYTAAIYHSASVGKTQLDNKLAASGLDVKTATVKQVTNQHAYQVDVTVSFKPLFAQLSIPTLAGPQAIIPNGFDVNYAAITDVSVY